MLEGARRLGRQFLQQRVVGIGQLDEPRDGHQVEHLLEEIDEGVEGHGGHGTHENLDEVDPPGGAVAHIDEAEAHEHGQFHAEEDGGVDELAPAHAEVTEGLDGDHAGHQVHHEEFHAASAENQQREQGHEIGGHHHPFAEERQQIQGEDRIRDHVHEPRRRTLHHEGEHGGQQEHEKDVIIASPV